MKTFLAATVIAVSLATALCVGSLFSQAKLGVSNPVSSAYGLIQVALFDAERVEVQGYPRVVIAQPEASLEDLMEEEGFVEDEDARMGSVRVFASVHNEGFLKHVKHTENTCFSLWAWQE